MKFGKDARIETYRAISKSFAEMADCLEANDGFKLDRAYGGGDIAQLQDYIVPTAWDEEVKPSGPPSRVEITLALNDEWKWVGK